MLPQPTTSECRHGDHGEHLDQGRYHIAQDLDQSNLAQLCLWNATGGAIPMCVPACLAQEGTVADWYPCIPAHNEITRDQSDRIPTSLGAQLIPWTVTPM